MKLTHIFGAGLLAASLFFAGGIAAPVLACGQGECGGGDDGGGGKPDRTKPGRDGEPVEPWVREYFAVCTCLEFETAWGFETKEFREDQARAQCLVLRETTLRCELTDPDAIVGPTPKYK